MSYKRDYYYTSWHRRLTVLLGAAKSRRKNLVTITREQLQEQVQRQGYLCFYTGRPLILDTPDKYDMVSMDRLDNEKGYVPGNVVFTTWRINRAKSNMSHQDFIELCKVVSEYHYSPPS